MKTQEAIEYFGGRLELAQALGIWPTAIYKWGDTVPRGKAFEIEVITRGKLRVKVAPNRVPANG